MSELSNDAKTIAGAWWGLPIGEKTVVTFHMIENRPTARAQAALDELVAAGFLWRETFNRHGGVSYRPLGPSMRKFGRWIAKHKDDDSVHFAVTEPILAPRP